MKTQISKSLFAYTLLAIGILFGISGTSVRAAVIWQTPTTISGDSDVSKQGTLLQAFNLGNSTAGSAIVNGVTFNNSYPGTNTTIGTGEGSLTISGAWGGNATAFGGGTSTPYANLSSGYQSLLIAASYSTTTASDLTLNNLVVGQQYLVQFWANDSRSLTNVLDRTDTFDSSVTIDFNVQNQLGGVGQYVIGTFTATTATQGITLTTAKDTLQLNGFQIRSIPEPGTASLALAATGMLLLLRRRKS